MNNKERGSPEPEQPVPTELVVDELRTEFRRIQDRAYRIINAFQDAHGGLTASRIDEAIGDELQLVAGDMNRFSTLLDNIEASNTDRPVVPLGLSSHQSGELVDAYLTVEDRLIECGIEERIARKVGRAAMDDWLDQHEARDHEKFMAQPAWVKIREEQRREREAEREDSNSDGEV